MRHLIMGSVLYCTVFLGGNAVAAQPQLCIGKTCINVEVVTTKEEMAIGLSGRPGLGFNQGMLFVFKDEAVHRFWMKGMKFPLDIIWIDKQMKVVAIKDHLSPCRGETCPIYAPPAKARYVLEISAGLASAYRIKLGAKCVLRN